MLSANQVIVHQLSYQDFLTEKESWDAKVSEMLLPNIFMSWGWIRAWCQFRRNIFEPIFLRFVDDGVALGYLPLYIESSKGAKILKVIGTDLYIDHVDMISSATDAKSCISALELWLNESKKDWDKLEINGLIEFSEFLELNASSNRYVELSIQSVAPFVTLRPSFNDYMSSYSKKKRYNLKYAFNKLEKERFASYIKCEESDLKDGLEELFNLHERRSTSKGIESSFSKEMVGEFHFILLENVELESIFLRKLQVDGKTIAMLYGFSFQGCLFDYQITHDPEWDEYAPGAALLYKVLEEVHDLGLSEFNFLQGNEAYKYKWTKSQRELLFLKLWSPTMSGRMWQLFDRTMSMMKRIIKAFLSNLVKSN